MDVDFLNAFLDSLGPPRPILPHFPLIFRDSRPISTTFQHFLKKYGPCWESGKKETSGSKNVAWCTGSPCKANRLPRILHLSHKNSSKNSTQQGCRRVSAPHTGGGHLHGMVPATPCGVVCGAFCLQARASGSKSWSEPLGNK